MGRPRKSLEELVRDGSFYPNKAPHRELLAGPPLRWKALADLQERYRTAAFEIERRRIAREFDEAAASVRDQHRKRIGNRAEVLAKLGPIASSQRVLAMFPRFFRHPTGALAGRPFRLESHQELVLREFLDTRDRRGRRVYRWLLLGAGRGWGKTPVLTGLGYEALLSYDDAPEVDQVAGSQKQAGIGMNDFAKPWRENSPQLGQWTHAAAWSIACPENGGKFDILTSDGRHGHGGRGRRSLVDEWWAFETKREEQAYIALASALHKDERADLIAGTTAGYDKTSQLGIEYDVMLKAPDVEILNDGCLTIARDRAAGKLMYWWGLPEDVQLEKDAILAGEHDAILRACNPLSVLSLDAIRAQFALLPYEEACRLILNQWTKAKDVWLSAGIWRGLRSNATIPAGADIWVAVDAAKSRDTTACVWGRRLEDGRVHLRSRVWAAREDVPHDVLVPGGRIRNSLVEKFILEELNQRYRVREVAFDPRYFDTQAENLDDAGLTVVEFPRKGGVMFDATTHFYDSAHDGTTAWNGADTYEQNDGRSLEEHVTAASAVWTESGWVIFRTKQTRPIDALSASIMCRERAMYGEDSGGYGFDDGTDYEFTDDDDLLADLEGLD